MRILIAGCGYVGCALGSLLSSEGHEVFGLRRNTGVLPSVIRPVAVDLKKEIPPGDLPSAPDYVFYTASADGSDDEAYREAYVDGPRNLLRALISRGEPVRRLFFTSSTGVYGQSGGEWVDESSPTEPATFSGRRLLEGERVVLDSPFPAAVVRLSGIYGPGRTRSMERASEICADDGPVYTNRIHRDDCAGALRHLMLLPTPEKLYVGVDHEPADRRTVAEWLAGRRSASPNKNPSSTNRRTNKRCSNARLVASGYEFRYPTFREGFSALLEEAGG